MALDRQSIEKRDFPIGRRGYEPAAVDQHLSAIAREVEALKQAKAREPAAAPDAAEPDRVTPDTLASFASVQVQAIVEAAEASAAAIESEARENAEQAAADAAADAERTREEAVERSQEHVGKVRVATELMLKRLTMMESELEGLIESLRTGANSLNSELTVLSTNMDDLYVAAGRTEDDAPEDLADVELDDDDDDEADDEDAVDGVDASEADEDGEPSSRGDIEAARLVALNMALNGQSRDQTDRYLADNFDLRDRKALLDEVYATVGG